MSYVSGVDPLTGCDDQESPLGQLIGYQFKVRMEFDVCLLFVYLGALRSFFKHQRWAYVLDVLSSLYLLWATFTRQSYRRNSPVALWGKDICIAATSDKSLIYDYLAVSIASWLASTFLECTSSARFVKLYTTRLAKFTRFSQLKLSHSRLVVLVTTIFCTVNSLFLTLILWGAVQQSLENVSQDSSVVVFLTIAAIMRLVRQFMEGLTFIAGIATRDFKWKNSNAECVFGRISFSSFILLLHSSVLTYAFCDQETKVWSVKQLCIFVALCIDVIFRLIVCVWATYNSCCFIQATHFLKTSNPLAYFSRQSVPVNINHWLGTGILTIVYNLIFIVGNVIITQRHVYYIIPCQFLNILSRSVTYVVVNILLYCYLILCFTIYLFLNIVHKSFTIIVGFLMIVKCVVVFVLTVVRQRHILHQQDDHQFIERDIAIEYPLPGDTDGPFQLDEQETVTDHIQDEMVFPSALVNHPHIAHPDPHFQCPLLLAQHVYIRYQCPSILKSLLEPTSDLPGGSTSDLPADPPIYMDAVSDIAVIAGYPFPLCQLEISPRYETIYPIVPRYATLITSSKAIVQLPPLSEVVIPSPGKIFST